MSDHPTIIFDGLCNLCEWSVVFVIRRDASGRFRFTPAQSEVGEALQRRYGISAIAAGTMVLIKDGAVYTKSDAALEIAKDLDGPWRAFAVLALVPRPLRNWVYSFIGKRRYAWFGKKTRCLVPTRDLSDRFL